MVLKFNLYHLGVKINQDQCLDKLGLMFVNENLIFHHLSNLQYGAMHLLIG